MLLICCCDTLLGRAMQQQAIEARAPCCYSTVLPLLPLLSLLLVLTPPIQTHLAAKFRRMRPRKTHFDGVINEYKELELHDPDPSVAEAIAELQAIFIASLPPVSELETTTSPTTPPFLPPHCLCYPASAAPQQLKPHVDSTRFSGSYVCGYTLTGSPDRYLRLKWSEDPACVESPLHSTRQASPPVEIDIPLPSNSGYVLSGYSRYNMTHEVIGDSDSDRIAIILRDELQEERVKFTDPKFGMSSVPKVLV